MQMLYQADIGKQTADQVRATFWKAGDEVEPDVRGFAEDLFRVAVAHQEKNRRADCAELEALAAGAHARRGPQPAAHGRGRDAGFKGTPFPIVINEALEIGRRYCAPESINFLNGMLDSIARGLIPK